MKTMSCQQLGGACDKKFQADSFDKIVEMSKLHGMEMFQTQDAGHMKAMGEIQAMMQKPDGMQRWFEQKKNEFEALPED